MPLAATSLIWTSRGERDGGGDAEATLGRQDRQRSAGRSEALANAGEAEAGRARDTFRIAAAVVLDADQQRIVLARAPLDTQRDFARRAVAERVGQAFLRDTIGRCGSRAADVGEIAPEIEL